jgi:hypothetical protein
MNRLLLVCLSAMVWCLVSCTDKDKIPAGILPKEKMQKVLWDMILAERFRESFIKDSSKDLKAESFKLYAQVFEVHKISKDEFIKSYKFYMSRPDIARSMFDSLSTQANRRREEIYKTKPLDTAQVKQPATTTPVDSAKAVKSPAVVPHSPLPQPPMPVPLTPNKIPVNRLKLKHLPPDSLFRYKKPKL